MDKKEDKFMDKKEDDDVLFKNKYMHIEKYMI